MDERREDDPLPLPVKPHPFHTDAGLANGRPRYATDSWPQVSGDVHGKYRQRHGKELVAPRKEIEEVDQLKPQQEQPEASPTSTSPSVAPSRTEHFLQ